MNRTAILFLALAVLLAHMVAIHQTPAGEFAPPYDLAHVAFRMGRNLVHEGALTWNRGEGVHSSYPSLLWVGLCAISEQLYISPILATQAIGMICTLGSVLVLTQFSLERRSGLIAPLLLAASGCAAAAGTSGTEASLSMLLLTATMLAFERRLALAQLVSGVLLALTQPTAIWALAMLLLLEFCGRPLDARRQPTKRRLLAPLAPFGALFTLAVLRYALIGVWLAPTETLLLQDPLGQLSLGLSYMRGFFLGSGSGLLVLLPLLILISGRSKKGHGRRALMVSMAWFLGVAFTGGSELPFWNALAPALPLLFVSIQDGFTRLVDFRRIFQPAAVVILLLGGLASLAVSKVPGSLGPFQVEELHRSWMTPPAGLRETYGAPLGRLGLMEEIRRVERLRQIGLFVRDNLPKATTLGSTWPGAVGYLSRRPVHDLLGRASPLPGKSSTLPWSGCPQVDLTLSFGLLNDYLLAIPSDGASGDQGFQQYQEELRSWLGRPGNFSIEHFGSADLAEALAPYEPVSVPVMPLTTPRLIPDPNPARLMRRRDKRLTPQIRIEPRGEFLEVLAIHRGHAQIVDLALRFQTTAGEILWMRPNGEWLKDPAADQGSRTRTDLMLTNTGPRSISLVRFRPPAGYGKGFLQAQLLDPNEDFWWAIGSGVRHEL